MKVYLDFDGTVVEHNYPKIGAYNPLSMEVVKKLQNAGHEIVLNTFRVEFRNHSEQEALDYVNKDGFKLKKIRCTSFKIIPEHYNIKKAIDRNVLFIDDASIGTPLIDSISTKGKMVDWVFLDKEFKKYGLYKKIGFLGLF